MNSVITRGLENNNIKKKKSPRTNPLKNEYSEFLKKSKSPKKPVLEKIANKKKISIVENKKDPVFIKTNQRKPIISPKKQEQRKPIISPKKQEQRKPIISPKKQEQKQVGTSKTHSRFSKKSKRRKLDKKHTKSRKISFRCYPQKNKNIGEVIERANKLSEEEMKKELLSNGIEIKGTKNKLLKDIYMFSSLGGIKIHRE